MGLLGRKLLRRPESMELAKTPSPAASLGTTCFELVGLVERTAAEFPRLSYRGSVHWLKRELELLEVAEQT